MKFVGKRQQGADTISFEKKNTGLRRLEVPLTFFVAKLIELNTPCTIKRKLFFTFCEL